MPLDFREVCDQLSTGVAVYEAREDGNDFVFVDFNRGAERIDKIRKEVVLGKSVLEVFPQIREFGLFEVFQRVWRTGCPEQHPIRIYQDERITGWRENHVCRLASGEIVAIYDDLTQRRQSEETLKESESLYRALVELSNDGIALVQGEKHIYVNQKMVDIFGYDQPDEIIGQPISLLIHPEDFERVSGINRKRQEGLPVPERYDFKGIRKDGRPVFIEISASKVTYRGEAVSLVFMRDVTRRKEAEEKVRQAGEEWQQTFDSMSDGVSLHAVDGTVVKINHALGRLLKISPEAIRGEKCYQLFHHQSKPVEGCPMLRSVLSKTPEVQEIFEPSLSLWLSIVCSPLVNETGRVTGVVHVVRDVTDRKREEEELRALSLIDELTGLNNRRGFITLADHALKTARRMKRNMWLLFADLDGLKKINDAFGHLEGDQVLMETAAIFNKTFRESDILGRFGGDEFVVLGMGTVEATSEMITNRLRQVLKDRNARKDHPYALSLSLGFSLFDPKFPVSVEDLLSQADRQMYQDKRKKAMP
jgi:diguanylate cyclase (GGDEF)-like protein/PAS domain S-box-containing protein